MTIKIKALMILPLAMVAAVPAVAQMTNMAPAAPRDAPATDAMTYIAKAGAGDLFEIESSKAVMMKTKNAAVRRFAQMMITDHTKSTAQVKAAAMKASLKVAPPMLDANQQSKLDAIKAANGKEAVSTYMAAQREAHSQALALHSGYAQQGGTPSLKMAAGKIAPVVQMHIDMLAKLPGA